MTEWLSLFPGSVEYVIWVAAKGVIVSAFGAWYLLLVCVFIKSVERRSYWHNYCTWIIGWFLGWGAGLVVVFVATRPGMWTDERSGRLWTILVLAVEFFVWVAVLTHRLKVTPARGLLVGVLTLLLMLISGMAVWFLYDLIAH